MAVSRRGFLQLTGATAAGTALGGVASLGLDLRSAHAAAQALRIKNTRAFPSVCPYCAVGCSVVIHTLGDRAKNVKPTVVHIEGDTESPINRGTLCSKGISLKQYVVNDRRLTRPLYRAPGATEWSPISWEEAIANLARRIKDTRDRGFEETDAKGRSVRRLRNLAIIGGCTDTNEINYLLGKFRFGLGVLTYENQARL